MCIQRPSSWLGLGLTALAALHSLGRPREPRESCPVSSSLGLEGGRQCRGGDRREHGEPVQQGTSVSPLNASATATAINGGTRRQGTITGSASWV